MTDTVSLALIRAAAEAPAATPLVARLQAMLQQLLPLHEAAQSQRSGLVSDQADAYEPTREEINAFFGGGVGYCGGQQDGVPHTHGNGAAGQFGQLAGFDGDLTAIVQRNGLGMYYRFFHVAKVGIKGQ